MTLRLRFTAGILFSLILHALLIYPLFNAYPELRNRGVWFWKELPLFQNEKTTSSVSIFENREKLISDLERNKNLINTINDEIALKKDQIQRFELALSKDAYPFVQFSQYATCLRLCYNTLILPK